MPGPLPDPESIRRNAPTIPTTKLPAGGRRGDVPEPPSWIELGRAGWSWWEWAWRTPQACAWDDGQLVKVAHRASLEDDLIAVEVGSEVDGLFEGLADAKSVREAKLVMGRLAGLVSGRSAILARISDIDEKLGLSPKGRDALRLKVVADVDYYPPEVEPEPVAKDAAAVTRLSDRRKRSVADAS